LGKKPKQAVKGTVTQVTVPSSPPATKAREPRADERGERSEVGPSGGLPRLRASGCGGGSCRRSRTPGLPCLGPGITEYGNTHVMRITTKGQVTIPQEIREELGLLPNTEVTFEVVDGEARLRKARRGVRLSRGDGVIGHIRGVRPSNKLTTDEIMALMRGKP
jgi:AbrB family looped-hinge helix DNA binding protein